MAARERHDWLAPQDGLDIGASNGGGTAKIPFSDILGHVDLRGSDWDRIGMESALWRGAARSRISGLMVLCRKKSGAEWGMKVCSEEGREDICSVRLEDRGGFGALGFGLERCSEALMARALSAFAGRSGASDLAYALGGVALRRARAAGKPTWVGIGQELANPLPLWEESDFHEIKARWAISVGSPGYGELPAALRKTLSDLLARLGMAVAAGLGRLAEGERIDLLSIGEGRGMLWIEAPSWRGDGWGRDIWALTACWLEAIRVSFLGKRLDAAPSEEAPPPISLHILAEAPAENMAGMLRWGRAAGAAVAVSEAEDATEAAWGMRHGGGALIRLIGGSSPRLASGLADMSSLPGPQRKKALEIAENLSPGEALAMRFSPEARVGLILLRAADVLARARNDNEEPIL